VGYCILTSGRGKPTAASGTCGAKPQSSDGHVTKEHYGWAVKRAQQTSVMALEHVVSSDRQIPRSIPQLDKRPYAGQVLTAGATSRLHFNADIRRNSGWIRDPPENNCCLDRVFLTVVLSARIMRRHSTVRLERQPSASRSRSVERRAGLALSLRCTNRTSLSRRIGADRSLLAFRS